MNDDNREIVQDIMAAVVARADEVIACARVMSDECMRVAMDEFMASAREAAAAFEEMESEK